MGLIRLLVFAAVVALVYQLVKRWLNSSKTPKKVTHGGDMVRCQHCGTFVPRETAISADNKYYCSKTHQEADNNA